MQKAWHLIGMLVVTVGCTNPHTGFASPEGDMQKQKTQVSSESGFTVTISLSEKARKRLVESKETIIVAGYITGNPKKDALKQYVNRMGEVELGDVKADIMPGENASFGHISIKRNAFEQTDKTDLQILINVFSGRKSSKDNLLDCGIYQGPLKSIQGGSATISCKLIAE
jgi:hypothetical protein